MFAYERRHQPLASPKVFRARLLRSGTFGFVVVTISLAAGMTGYSLFEGLGFLDSFVNTAMILSGMGPMHNPQTAGGKIFAGIYALYSGFAVLVVAAITFAPFIHRVLHRFHLETEEETGGEKSEKKAPDQRSSK
jgi:hypothetical protein